MKCPVCKGEATLLETRLEDNLRARRCARCEGTWVGSNDYLAWLRGRGTAPLQPAASELPWPVWDTREIKLCPECGHILTRFRIVPGVEFVLDRCAHCTGVWFDKGEWDALVQHGLHDRVNEFFMQPWQTRLRHEETHAKLDRLYLEKFGAEDYARLKDVRAWLCDHPLRAMLLAYLQAEDPYEM